MDAALEETHTGMYAFLRWRTAYKHMAESLEHLASYNGAEIHALNTLYTLKLEGHMPAVTNIMLLLSYHS